MRKRDVVIRLSLTEAEAAMFEGRNAMFVPLSDTEAERLWNTVNGVDHFLKSAAKGLAVLKDLLETTGDKDGRIGHALVGLLGPVRDAIALHDETRQLLGRAVFVGGDDPEKVVQ